MDTLGSWDWFGELGQNLWVSALTGVFPRFTELSVVKNCTREFGMEGGEENSWARRVNVEKVHQSMPYAT